MLKTLYLSIELNLNLGDNVVIFLTLVLQVIDLSIFFLHFLVEVILLKFKLVVSDCDVLGMFFQEDLFLLEVPSFLSIELINLLMHFFLKLLFFEGKLLCVLSVLLDLSLCNFFPFTKELDIVLLGLLFNQFIVFVHFSHKANMAIVHLFHILFNLNDVFLGKLDW